MHLLLSSSCQKVTLLVAVNLQFFHNNFDPSFEDIFSFFLLHSLFFFLLLYHFFFFSCRLQEKIWQKGYCILGPGARTFQYLRLYAAQKVALKSWAVKKKVLAAITAFLNDLSCHLNGAILNFFSGETRKMPQRRGHKNRMLLGQFNFCSNAEIVNFPRAWQGFSSFIWSTKREKTKDIIMMTGIFSFLYFLCLKKI